MIKISSTRRRMKIGMVVRRNARMEKGKLMKIKNDGVAVSSSSTGQEG